MKLPMLVIAAIASLALAGAPAPLRAGNGDLDRVIAVLPAIPDVGQSADPLFVYAAVPQDRTPEALAEIVAVADEAVLRGLLEPVAATAKTGIDFAKIESLLSFGSPPAQGLILFGADDFAVEADDVLGKIGFETQQVEGSTVLVRGEDNAIDFARRDPDFPFGGSMGQSRRLAVGSGRVIVAQDTPTIRKALRMITSRATCVTCRHAAAALSALASRSGSGTRIIAAYGVTALATAGAAIDPALVLEGMTVENLQGVLQDAAPADTPDAKGKLPTFVVAVLAVTESNGQLVGEIALTYPQAASARDAMAALAVRLSADPAMATLPKAMVETAVVEADVSVAIASVRFPAGSPRRAMDLYMLWVQSILRRDFAILDVTR